MRARSVLAPFLVTALLLGSCSDDDADGGDDADDPRSEEQLAADIALAESVALQASDLPAGWEVSADTDTEEEQDEDDELLSEAMSDCMGQDMALFGNDNAEHDSDDFELEDATASGSVTVYPDVETATARYEQILLDDIPSCYSRVFQEQFEREMAEDPPEEGTPEVTVEDVSMERTEAPQVGDQSVSFRLTLTVGIGGMEFSFYGDLLTFRAGRIAATVDFFNVETPIDTAVRDAAFQAVAARATAAA